MTTEKLKEIFKTYEPTFEEEKGHNDVMAFNILNEFSDLEGGDIVSSASHDQIWLTCDIEVLAKNLSEDQVKTLIRCGVWFDQRHDSLSMFV